MGNSRIGMEIAILDSGGSPTTLDVGGEKSVELRLANATFIIKACRRFGSNHEFIEITSERGETLLMQPGAQNAARIFSIVSLPEDFNFGDGRHIDDLSDVEKEEIIENIIGDDDTEIEADDEEMED